MIGKDVSASRPLPASCHRKSIKKDSGPDGVIARILVSFDWNIGNAELPRGENKSPASHDAVFAIDQDR